MYGSKRSYFMLALLLVSITIIALLLLRCGKTSESPPPDAAPGARAPAGEESPISAVDRMLETMEPANIAFNAPRSLNIKDTAQIQLLLSLEQSIEDLRSAITAEGEREGHQIRVSNRMEAHLTGPSFQITAITPEEQAITSRGITEWKWEVKPATIGQQNLHLTMTALFVVDGTQTRRAFRTFDKTIRVEVTPRQQVSAFFEKNWQWLWAAILIPLVGWMLKRWKNRSAQKT